MVYNRGIAGSVGIGNPGISGGEDDVPSGLQRDAVMPGIEPDQRLSSGGRTVGSRMDVDGLIDGIARGRFQRVLYLALGIDVITRCIGVELHPGADYGLGVVLASEATDGQHARRKQSPQEGATMIVPSRHLEPLIPGRVTSI